VDEPTSNLLSPAAALARVVGTSLLASRAILARSVRAVKKQIMMMKKRLPNASKEP